jgi:hypothetical protein
VLEFDDDHAAPPPIEPMFCGIMISHVMPRVGVALRTNLANFTVCAS